MNASRKKKPVGLAEKLKINEKIFHDKIIAVQRQSTHAPTQGSETENLWINLLRQYLPLRYRIDRGFVVDSNGSVSEQIDCIVYDALYTPRLYGGKDNLCILAEAVYAVFESKPSATKKHIEYACQKADSVRALCREKASVVVDRGEKHASREPFRIIGGLFAVSLGAKFDTVEKHFQTLDLDCILVSDENNPSYWDKFDEEASSNTGKGALITGIFRFLRKLQALGTVPPINWETYEKAIRNE